MRRLLGLLVLLSLTLSAVSAVESVKFEDDPAPQIYVLSSDPQIRRGALEVRRYLYQISGEWLQISNGKSLANHEGGIVLGISMDARAVGLRGFPHTTREGGHTLHDIQQDPNGTPFILLTAEHPTGVLYAAYSFLERLGVRFRIEGDVLTSRLRGTRVRDLLTPLRGVSQAVDPSFAVRGLQPFHDFSAGPDWWNEWDYKFVFEQMAKMKMNFMGLHTYPIPPPGAPTPAKYGVNISDVCAILSAPEPTVWIGVDGGFNATTGDVTPAAAYPSTYMTTAGYLDSLPVPFAMNTSNFGFGAGRAFPSECFGSNAMLATACTGYGGVPRTPDADADLFNEVGRMLRGAFDYARTQLGHKTAVGTEIPLRPPPNAPSSATTQELYEGVFKRIQASYPIDYYWFWTPEGWEWQHVPVNSSLVTDAVADLNAAAQAARATNVSFDLATCGWVLGPLGDRALLDTQLPEEFVALSSIEEQLGWWPTDPSYAQVSKRGKWTIPWMEDDSALASPQLWVTRTIDHAFVAQDMGVEGLMGIHWRTHEVSPQISALASFPWHQSNSMTATALDIYVDITSHEFGLDGGDALEVAALMTRYDSFNLPHQRPPHAADKRGPFGGGCSGFAPQSTRWSDISTDFAFVDKFAGFRSKVQGVDNLARFDRWTATYRLMRAESKTYSVWGEFVDALKTSTPGNVSTALSLRVQLVEAATDMMAQLVSTIDTMGALGTLADVVQRGIPAMFTQYDKTLTSLLGHALPTNATVPTSTTVDRVVALSPRASILDGETYDVTVIGFSSSELISSIDVYYRAVPSETYERFTVPAVAQGREVFTVRMPASVTTSDFQWYVASAKQGMFPPAGPEAPIHVIVV